MVVHSLCPACALPCLHLETLRNAIPSLKCFLTWKWFGQAECTNLGILVHLGFYCSECLVWAMVVSWTLSCAYDCTVSIHLCTHCISWWPVGIGKLCSTSSLLCYASIAVKPTYSAHDYARPCGICTCAMNAMSRVDCQVVDKMATAVIDRRWRSWLLRRIMCVCNVLKVTT